MLAKKSQVLDGSHDAVSLSFRSFRRRLGLLLSAVMMPLSAQTPADVMPAALSRMVDATLARYPDAELPQAQREEAQAIARKSQAWLAADPSLRISHQDGALGSNPRLRTWEAGLDLPLWLPAQHRAWQQLARQSEAARLAYTRYLRWQVSGEVRELLWTAALAKNRLLQAQQAQASASVLHDQVRRQVQAGELPQMDQLLSENELLARQAEVVAAQAELDRAMTQARSLIGMDITAEVLPEPLCPVRLALQDHPLYTLSGLRVARAQAEQDRARGERRAPPVLSVGSRRERGAYDPVYTNSVGVELTVPLGLTSQAGPAIASQALAVAEAQAEFKRTQREVELNWRQAQQTLTSTRQAQQVAEQRSTLAKRNLQMAQSAFNLGEIDLMDLLRVREQSLNAVREREQQTLLLERAIALCNQSAGVIP